jgi:hypothetical protein
MASMYPERLPKHLSNDAERRLFQQLKESLSTDYTVIWHAHVALTMTGKHENSEQAVIDFLLIHPQRGMLALAVKSGVVGYDEQNNAWYTVDPDQERCKLRKSPLEQAMTSMYRLCAQFDRQGLCYNGTVGYAMVLLDVDTLSTEEIAQNAHIDPAILLSSQKIQSITLQESIEHAYQYHQKPDDRAPGDDDTERIIFAYQRSWFLVAPYLNAAEEKEKRRVELTEQQFVLLEMLYTHAKAAIYGCPGTGKTLLALEKARQLAHNGLKVLLICQSTKLAAILAEQLARECATDTTLKNIHTYNFRTFCKVHLENRLHFSLEDDPYMLYLLKRIRHTMVRYDAIIVDEAQDFRESWWIGMLALLNTKESMLYAFYDNNQNTQKYPLCDQYIPIEQKYSLSLNCRSTQKIHQKMLNYYDALPGTSIEAKPLCSGPKGKEIEYIRTYKQQKGLHISEQDSLANLLDRLIYDDEKHIPNIILLTPLEQKSSRFQAGTIFGERYYLSWIKRKNAMTNGHYILTCSSIHNFKGQERDIVILVELDTLKDVKDAEIVLYTAISRARQHFIVLGPGNSIMSKLLKRKTTH